MNHEEFFALLADELPCVNMDSKIDDARVSLTPIMNLLKEAPPDLRTQPGFTRLVMLYQMQALMGRKQMRLSEPVAFRISR